MVPRMGLRIDLRMGSRMIPRTVLPMGLRMFRRMGLRMTPAPAAAGEP